MGILLELKSFKQIRNFYYKINMRNILPLKNNQNLNKYKINSTYKIEEIFEKSLFCVNIGKYNNLLLQKFITFYIENYLENNKFLYSKSRNSNYLQGNHIFCYNISSNNFSKKLKSVDITLQFNKSRFNIDFIYYNKNKILNFDKEFSSEYFNKKINVDLLLNKIALFFNKDD
jgi:hypothetical protein